MRAVVAYAAVKSVLADAWRVWRERRGSTHAAALAFYSAFAATPVLVVLIALAGTLIPAAAAQRILLQELARVVDADVAALLRDALERARASDPGWSAVIAGVAALAGAIGVFGQLRNAMNAIWDVAPGRVDWREAARGQLVSFALALATGLVVVVLSAVGAALTGAETLLPPSIRGDTGWLRVLYEAVSLSIMAFLFAVLYRTLPAVDVSWRDVWTGGIAAAALFQLGRHLFSIYLARSGLVSLYGAASSLAVLLTWLYYSAQAFLIGAALARARQRAAGSASGPDDRAKSLAAIASSQRPASAREVEECAP